MNPAAVLSVLVQARGIEETNRQLRKIDVSSRRTADSTQNLEKHFARAGSSASAASEGMGQLSVRVGALGGSLGSMVPLLATATPALIALGGAAAAVAGSLGAAAAGAGALGAGMAASLAPVLVVGKQVTSRFEEIKKAYDLVKTAQREGTAESRKNAEQALAGLSKSERAMVASFGRISDLQKKVLGPASDKVIGSLSKAIDTLAPSLSKLEKPFTALGSAIGGSIERIAKALSGPTWTKALSTFVKSAERIIGPITTIFLSVASIFRDIATAAIPMVKDALDGIAGTFRDLDKDATKSRIGEIVRGLVDQTKSWFGLFMQVGELIFRVFSGGASQGKGLVDALTLIVGKWNEFLASAQGQNTIKTFFDVSVGAVRAFGQIIGIVVSGVSIAVGAIAGFAGKVRDTFSGGDESATGSVRKFAENAKALFGMFIAAAQEVGQKVAEVFSGSGIGGDLATIGRAFLWLEGIVTTVVVFIARRTIPMLITIIQSLATIVRGVVRVIAGIFSGDFQKIWDGVKDIVSGAMGAIVAIVKGLGGLLLEGAILAGKTVGKGILKGLEGLAGLLWSLIKSAFSFLTDPQRVAATAKTVGDAIGKGILSGLGSLGHLILDKVKDALGFVADNLPGPLGTAAKIGSSIAGKIGDGAGRAAKASLPSGAGLSGGSLMGAKSIMSPFASMAGRFGLHTSSGLRPGAITSSGNPSYHGTGNAIDEAGSPAGMLGYFKYLRSNFGSRLRELIYTPGGVGIKDGRPFRYTGQVAADHFDHVHVAFTGGAGDGIGRAPRTGDGAGNEREARELITKAWDKTKGFLNGSSQPAVSFVNGGGMRAGRNKVIVPRSDIGPLLAKSSSWESQLAKSNLIHEFAHTKQRNGLAKWASEGAAQLFMRARAGEVWSALIGRGFSPYEGDGNYASYVARVRKELGDKFVNRGQFMWDGSEIPKSARGHYGDYRAPIGIGQIKALWTKAGGSAGAQNLAAAVAMAESGGNASASNRNSDGSIDRGLWQINSVHGRQSTFDRVGNAKAAVSISKNGRNWNPWVAYTNGSYKKFLGAASKTKTSGGSSTSAASNGSSVSAAAQNAPESPTYTGQAMTDPFGTTMTAGAFAKAQKSGAVLGRPLKGGGPTKGLPSGYVPPTPVDVPALPTADDFLNANVARARLTETKDDDIAALTALRDFRKAQMDAALADSDPRNDEEAIDAYLAVKDSLDGLKESIDQANALQQQRDDVNRQIADNQAKILALALQGPKIVSAVVAAVSGGIGGQVGLGMQTPGYAGEMARY